MKPFRLKVITTAVMFDSTSTSCSPGNSGWAFLPAAVCNQATDQQGLHRRHHRESPLHPQWGVAAPRECGGQATGRISHFQFIFHILSFAFEEVDLKKTTSMSNVETSGFFLKVWHLCCPFAEHQCILPGLWHGLTAGQGHEYRHYLPGEGKNPRGLL